MAETTTRLTPAQKVERARKAIDDFNRGEVNPEGYATDVVFHGSIIGEVKGRDAVAAALTKQRAAYQEFRQEPHAILADDDHTIALVNIKLRTGGQDVSGRQVLVTHTNSQGQITELWSMIDADTLKKLGR